MISSFHLTLILTFSIIGWISYQRRKVDFSGYISILIFTTILILISSYSLLTAISVAFFCSAIITTLKKKFNLKDDLEDTPRNWKQAISNMGIPIISMLLSQIIDEQSMTFIAFASLACASADTWSSEIGILSHSKPVLILSRKKVPPGVSGGVTFLGLLSSILGSLTIACVYYYFHRHKEETIYILLLGITGSVLDSIIGELFQAKYLSPKKELTDCASAGHVVKGYSIITNNLVNILAVTATGLIAFFLKKYIL